MELSSSHYSLLTTSSGLFSIASCNQVNHCYSDWREKHSNLESVQHYWLLAPFCRKLLIPAILIQLTFMFFRLGQKKVFRLSMIYIFATFCLQSRIFQLNLIFPFIPFLPNKTQFAHESCLSEASQSSLGPGSRDYHVR